MRNHPGCLCLYATLMLSRGIYPWQRPMSVPRDGCSVTVPPFPSLNRSCPMSATFLSMTYELKRFPLTSPRKLSLTCVKQGFLRTAEPHRTSQLSPCSPLMSQCHLHAVPGSVLPCPCITAPSAPPACEILSCHVSKPHSSHPAQSHI